MREIAWRPTPNGTEELKRKSDGTFVVFETNDVQREISQTDALRFFKTWPAQVALKVNLEGLQALGLDQWEIEHVIGHDMRQRYGSIEDRRILRGEHSMVPNDFL